MEFEKNLKKLEHMAEQMANGHLDLKKSIETFQKGTELIHKCRKELEKAEQTVKKFIKINDETGEIETEDFQVSSKK